MCGTTFSAPSIAHRFNAFTAIPVISFTVPRPRASATSE